MRSFLTGQGVILAQITMLTILFTIMVTQESAQLTTVILILTLALIGMSVGFILGQLIVIHEENRDIEGNLENESTQPEIFIEDIATSSQLDELFLQHLQSDGLFTDDSTETANDIPPIRPAV